MMQKTNGVTDMHEIQSEQENSNTRPEVSGIMSMSTNSISPITQSCLALKVSLTTCISHTGRSGFYNSGPVTWNALPASLWTDNKSYDTFSKTLKSPLFSNWYELVSQ